MLIKKKNISLVAVEPKSTKYAEIQSKRQPFMVGLIQVETCRLYLRRDNKVKRQIMTRKSSETSSEENLTCVIFFIKSF